MKRNPNAKEYREFLNRRDTGDSNHRHLCYRQRTRLYGDYLYHQDREKFEVECAEWVAKGKTNFLVNMKTKQKQSKAERAI
jgi:hypothetical protein